MISHFFSNASRRRPPPLARPMSRTVRRGADAGQAIRASESWLVPTAHEPADIRKQIRGRIVRHGPGCGEIPTSYGVPLKMAKEGIQPLTRGIHPLNSMSKDGVPLSNGRGQTDRGSSVGPQKSRGELDHTSIRASVFPSFAATNHGVSSKRISGVRRSLKARSAHAVIGGGADSTP